MWFVFRNHTIERFFPKGYVFSGYDDISVIPENAEGYLWFYQIPIKFNQGVIAAEIDDYALKAGYVLSRIGIAKQMVALTMEWLYAVPFADDDHRLKRAIANYNESLFLLAEQYPNLKVIDFNEFTRQYAISDLIDWKFYFISQMGLNPRLAKDFKEWFFRKMDEIASKRKKCLVFDLDNTLWGGVLGEDGIEGIQIGGDYPGNTFSNFQEALLELSKSGVILTICSKNNEKDVLEAWEKNPFLILKKEHFAAYRINWADKVTNIKEIAEELNIGLDSMVFVDDQPAEREFVRQMLPMVEVPEFPPQPYELPLFFKKLVEDYFKVYSVTDEDLKKTQLYKENASRAHEQKKYGDFNEFLKSLNIQLTIEQANEFNIPRIAQMTQKVNQFNLTTHRYTDAEVRQFLQKGWKIWCLSVADCFGNNGITGCIMINGQDIDSLLLSCRILGKGIEFAFVKRVLRILKENGMKEITASFIPTVKNVQVAEFYEKCSFSVISENKGLKNYKLSLDTSNLDIADYYHITIK